MKNFALSAVVAVALAATASAANLNIAVLVDTGPDTGQSATTVSGGAVVNYRIVGTLTDTLNDGLALWGSDLAMSGPAAVALAQATAGPGTCAGGSPMGSCTGMGCFVNPCGITNPAGYGGTISGNNLLQIGGGQNTIKNTDANAPFPIANVVENIAHSEEVLATGSVTMPATDGVYTLALSNVFANVIKDGQIALNGAFFATEAAGVGTVGSLSITVSTTPITMETLASAIPPKDNPYIAGTQPYRDILQTGTTAVVTQGIGAAGTPTQMGLDEVGGTIVYTYATISATFSGVLSPAPTTGNITVSCTDISATGAGDCPTVTNVSGAGPTYTLTLSGSIPTRECTTFTFPGTAAGEKLQYTYLPGDVNMAGSVAASDISIFVIALNNATATLPSNAARYNINRAGSVGNTDLLRLVGLLNGVSTTQVWTGATVAACP